MKQITLIVIIIGTSFLLGVTFKTLVSAKKANSELIRVTGIGGIFFKCKDPKAVNNWYKVHLGLNTGPYGTTFKWRQINDSSKKGLTQWSTFPEDTKYFNPSKRDFMINYRVDNLLALVEQLKNEKVIILDKVETTDYGKFVHILDIEGNKIQLWQPID